MLNPLEIHIKNGITDLQTAQSSLFASGSGNKDILRGGNASLFLPAFFLKFASHCRSCKAVKMGVKSAQNDSEGGRGDGPVSFQWCATQNHGGFEM